MGVRYWYYIAYQNYNLKDAVVIYLLTLLHRVLVIAFIPCKRIYRVFNSIQQMRNSTSILSTPRSMVSLKPREGSPQRSGGDTTLKHSCSEYPHLYQPLCAAFSILFFVSSHSPKVLLRGSIILYYLLLDEGVFWVTGDDQKWALVFYSYETRSCGLELEDEPSSAEIEILWIPQFVVKEDEIGGVRWELFQLLSLSIFVVSLFYWPYSFPCLYSWGW